jgi:hypothetical protein
MKDVKDGLDKKQKLKNVDDIWRLGEVDRGTE